MKRIKKNLKNILDMTIETFQKIKNTKKENMNKIVKCIFTTSKFSFSMRNKYIT